MAPGSHLWPGSEIRTWPKRTILTVPVATTPTLLRFCAENRLPVLSESSPVDAFDNPATELFNLHMGAIVAGSARVLRTFGYHDTHLAVSQRTINESALVAHRMNHQEPGQDLRIAQGLEIPEP